MRGCSLIRNMWLQSPRANQMANGICMTHGKEAEETVKFADTFDNFHKFFDCLNVSCFKVQ